MYIFISHFSSTHVQDILSLFVSVLNFCQLWFTLTWFFIYPLQLHYLGIFAWVYVFVTLLENVFIKICNINLFISNYLYVILICFQLYRMIYFICDTSLIGSSNLHLIMCSNRSCNGLLLDNSLDSPVVEFLTKSPRFDSQSSHIFTVQCIYIILSHSSFPTTVQVWII